MSNMIHPDDFQQQNQQMLQAFEATLIAKGLSKRTIRRHASNIMALATYFAEPQPQQEEPKVLSMLVADDYTRFLDDVAIHLYERMGFSTNDHLWSYEKQAPLLP